MAERDHYVVCTSRDGNESLMGAPDNPYRGTRKNALALARYYHKQGWYLGYKYRVEHIDAWVVLKRYECIFASLAANYAKERQALITHRDEALRIIRGDEGVKK